MMFLILGTDLHKLSSIRQLLSLFLIKFMLEQDCTTIRKENIKHEFFSAHYKNQEYLNRSSFIKSFIADHLYNELRSHLCFSKFPNQYKDDEFLFFFYNSLGISLLVQTQSAKRTSYVPILTTDHLES